MISRREALEAMAAGIGLGLSVGTAGCLDGGPSDQAQQSFDEARALLVENAETLDGLAAGDTDRNRQTIETVLSNVDDAQASLDGISMDEAGTLAPRIDHARRAAAFQAELAAYHDIALAAETAREDASAFADAEQNARAVERYEASQEHIQDLHTQLDDLEAAHEQIDHDAVDDPELSYSDPYTEYVDLASRDELNAHERQIEGELQINTVFVELETGFDALDREEYAAGRESFTAAKTAATRAKEAFEAVQEHDDAPRDLRNGSIALSGIAADLEEAIDLFIQATHEAEADNDQEALSLVEEGWAIVEAAFE